MTKNDISDVNKLFSRMREEPEFKHLENDDSEFIFRLSQPLTKDLFEIVKSTDTKSLKM